MYATNDRIIDASQKWDMYLKEKDITKINNCPIWNRLTSWDTMQDGHVITCGSDTIFDYLLPAQRDGFIGLQKYAVKQNKDFYTFVAIVKKYYPKDEIRTGAYYNPVILDELCKKYWPGENLIKHGAAVDIVYKPELLPEVKWHIGTVRYYDRAECEANKAKRLEHSRKMKAVSLELLQERAKKNKEKHNAQKREKRRIERKERQLALINANPIPAGLEQLSIMATEFGVHRSSVSRLIKLKMLEARLINGKYYCKRDDFMVYIKARRERERMQAERRYGKANKPHIVKVPDGYIQFSRAMEKYNAPRASLSRIIERASIPTITIGEFRFIHAEKLDARIEYEKNAPRSEWAKKSKPGAGHIAGYLTVPEAVVRVNRSLGILYKHLARGDFKSIVQNKLLYIDEHSLLNFYGLNQGSLFEEGAN